MQSSTVHIKARGSLSMTGETRWQEECKYSGLMQPVECSDSAVAGGTASGHMPSAYLRATLDELRGLCIFPERSCYCGLPWMSPQPQIAPTNMFLCPLGLAVSCPALRCVHSMRMPRGAAGNCGRRMRGLIGRQWLCGPAGRSASRAGRSVQKCEGRAIALAPRCGAASWIANGKLYYFQ